MPWEENKNTTSKESSFRGRKTTYFFFLDSFGDFFKLLFDIIKFCVSEENPGELHLRNSGHAMAIRQEVKLC